MAVVDASRRGYLEQVVEAAYLHTRPNCYFVGPYASRVSFKSQQIRVLDLIEGLIQTKRLREGDRVAVVGAGLAGITAAAALRGQDCIVDIFEGGEGIFHRQKEASHRLVHPTISRWPEERLRHTTDYGFADWYAAPASQIYAEILSDWETRIVPSSTTPKRKLNLVKSAVTKLSPQKPDGPVRLVTVPKNDHAYRCAIITTGFAEERVVAGLASHSYWQPKDQFSQWTEEELKELRASDKCVLISGCGDGGLIDCLRFVHGDFRNGWLAIEIAEMCQDTVAGIIIKAERDALMAIRSIRSTISDELPRDANSATRTPEQNDRFVEYLKAHIEHHEYVGALEAAYSEAVKRMPKAARLLLDKSIAKAGVNVGSVLLVAMEARPFIPLSAPIHKLMLRHALGKGVVEFESGMLRCTEIGVPLLTQVSSSKPFPNHPYIIRHGASANLGGLKISNDEQRGLHIRQLLLADYIDTQAPHTLKPPSGYPRLEPERQAYVSIRHSLAMKLIKSIMPGYSVRTSADGLGFEVYPLWDAEVARSKKEGYQLEMPGEMFGIRTEPSTQATGSLWV
ncbi:NAD(P)-binding protein [Hyphomonas sp.]|uniref:NAD(P)-binding protein n=1 Tax=Hyphomonas sp. TaxID=87 RepID=UPI0025C15C1D|nr:NAD(P)-binding protein [Hyphomonas sp.]